MPPGTKYPKELMDRDVRLAFESGRIEEGLKFLQQQQAAMETAQANLTRTKPLVEQDALSQKDLDDLRRKLPK